MAANHPTRYRASTVMSGTATIPLPHRTALADSPVHHIAVVVVGTAGWMTASPPSTT
jgi:hypothetical protein